MRGILLTGGLWYWDLILKSSATWLFVQQLIQANNKENMKPPYYYLFGQESTVDRSEPVSFDLKFLGTVFYYYFFVFFIQFPWTYSTVWWGKQQIKHHFETLHYLFVRGCTSDQSSPPWKWVLSADSEVHIVHISCMIRAYIVDSMIIFPHINNRPQLTLRRKELEKGTAKKWGHPLSW